MGNTYKNIYIYYIKTLTTITLLFSFLTAFSQDNCATWANCTPGNASSGQFFYGMGIFRVQLNTINNVTQDASEGYRNFFCGERTTLQAGGTYTLSVETYSANENVRAWIDFNNNQAFEANELVLSSDGKTRHTASFKVPANAVTNQYVRMRVSADNIVSSIPGPCTTPEYSQVEDYGIQVSNIPQEPKAQFSSPDTASCSGRVQFRDESLFVPETWQWNFGDGRTSTQQHPTHTYLTPGVYTVSLTVSNSAGSNQLTRREYINFHNKKPKDISCKPVTNDFCCTYGITRVAIGTMVNLSTNASAGYEDFTCSVAPVELYGGETHALSLHTSQQNPQDTKVWIDYNNDGQFHETNELAGIALNSINPIIHLSLPSTVLYDTPLRMRISSDYAGSAFNACTNLRHGQAEDYTLIVKENTNKPIAGFTIDAPPMCGRTYQFHDASQHTVLEYFWEFGDGQTSAAQNPVYTFSEAGTYEVRLTVRNRFGENTTAKTVLITDGPSPALCRPGSTSAISNIGIHKVIFNEINNSTATGDGYQDYSCSHQTRVFAGTSYELQVYTSNRFTENARAWIDYNNDGIFTDNELVLSSQARTDVNPHRATVIIPQATLRTPLRMRVMSDESTQPVPRACTALQYGQAEDYSIWIDASLSSSKPQTEDQLLIYPNPAKGIVTLKCSNSAEARIEVRNLLGQVVATYYKPQGQLFEQECNLTNVPKGIYLVTAYTTRLTSTQKLVIE